MVHIKYGENYLSKYLGLQRNLKRGFKIATLLLSLGGFLGWKYFEDYVWVALLLIAIIQMFTLIENQVIRSDKEIEDISNLKLLYTKYFNKLERLWTELDSSLINDRTAMSTFFKLRSKRWVKIEEMDNNLNIKRWKRLMNRVETETKEYITEYHSHE